MNKLSKEKSEYLLQHSSNPVDWYPWGSEAFQKAKKEDYLVIVSPNPITHLIMPFVELIRIFYSRFINKIYSNTTPLK